MKNNNLKISAAEMELMQIIWSKNEQITTSQLLAALPQDNTWKPTTVLTLASRLVEKGALSCRKQGKMNVYTPCITPQQYKEAQTQQFLKQVHQGSVKSFIAALHDSQDLSREDLNELRQWLEEV